MKDVFRAFCCIVAFIVLVTSPAWVRGLYCCYRDDERSYPYHCLQESLKTPTEWHVVQSGERHYLYRPGCVYIYDTGEVYVGYVNVTDTLTHGDKKRLAATVSEFVKTQHEKTLSKALWSTP